MSSNFYESDTVVLTAYCGGESSGFSKPTPAVQITTAPPRGGMAWVALNWTDAVKIARAILAEAEQRKHRSRT